MSVHGGHVFIDLGGVWIYARDEDVASLGDRFGFGRTGEQAVVADAVEDVDAVEAIAKAGNSVGRVRLGGGAGYDLAPAGSVPVKTRRA